MEEVKNVIECVDETIKNVCKVIDKREVMPDFYADTVKALAALVEVRAKLY